MGGAKIVSQCCNHYAPGTCGSHPWPNSNSNSLPPLQPIPSSLATPQTKKTNTRTPQACPHQWAQTSNSLGCKLPRESVIALHQNCAKQFKPKEIKPEILTAYFKDWPQARLEECDLLIQAVLGETGDKWNRAISLWDFTIDAWREIPVAYPHQYPPDDQKIVVRLPKINALTPSLPQSTPLTPHLVPKTPSTQCIPSTPDHLLTRGASSATGKVLEGETRLRIPDTQPQDKSVVAKDVIDLTLLPDSPGSLPRQADVTVKCEPKTEDGNPKDAGNPPGLVPQVQNQGLAGHLEKVFWAGMEDGVANCVQPYAMVGEACICFRQEFNKIASVGSGGAMDSGEAASSTSKSG
ncbi:uncharacterized protein MELLADRAFT_110669 [Melampsora larici-populina 98AG31]|uniref:Uncharacterized protein n=1 Tax=Melampsora larici-populina (strain 98AG31 / pathotype 3-4-7) TaxID=747676 RepID=F4S0J8_MELLP|nr:uncharacterized protein MELLADRAFT_110669 [Melampsora larici-populina 98AG31]EGG01854.1 hypothetical protein MELLADRAFT_110669 [Melampsora larici-populina 98AG31]